MAKCGTRKHVKFFTPINCPDCKDRIHLSKLCYRENASISRQHVVLIGAVSNGQKGKPVDIIYVIVHTYIYWH